MAALSPMMEQYFNIKKKYQDCILFFRLGDFYEMFFEDAILVSEKIDLTLTGRDYGQKERAPMCGVPYHSAENYMAKLIELGYKIAICEQLEDPKQAKGIVKRDVVRIVSPGTIIDSNMLDDKKNNYILCVYSCENGFALAAADVSTGEFKQLEILHPQLLYNEILNYQARELLCNQAFYNHFICEMVQKEQRIQIQILEDIYFDLYEAEKILHKRFDDGDLPNPKHKMAYCVCGALYHFLLHTQKNSLLHIHQMEEVKLSRFMRLNQTTRKNLEICENIRDGKKKASLLWVLDKTKTAMGGRLLKHWLEHPLINVFEINERLDAVEELYLSAYKRDELENALKTIKDFERILGKLVYGTANPKDLISLKSSFELFSSLKTILQEMQSNYLQSLCNEFDPLQDIYNLLQDAIEDDAPFSCREGNIIKADYHEEVKQLKIAKQDGQQWILKLEASEKQKTGIKNLKIKYNKIFSYYIEISNSNLSQVPDTYIRKQTLSNCERYITPELKELEEQILGADEKLKVLEYEIFQSVCEQVLQSIERIKKQAHIIASCDCLFSLAKTAYLYNYTKPLMEENLEITIKNGRHPVVERFLKDEDFISNHAFMDHEAHRMFIITGPNMAGKSTYMRQVALILFMGQIGSFVPAEYAKLGITDQIFTRVGASDDLSSGKSTFMMEMSEVSEIISQATFKSFIILDEIGRGTSTFDGLAIAWAVLEYIEKIKSRTLFSTHYHELSELEGKITGIVNYNILVEEKNDDIIFLRKIERGGCNTSYGIQVAKLAGLPQTLIHRAKEILEQLNENDVLQKSKKISKTSQQNAKAVQFDLFDHEKTRILEELKQLNIMNLNPVDALNVLYDLQKKAKEQSEGIKT